MKTLIVLIFALMIGTGYSQYKQTGLSNEHISDGIINQNQGTALLGFLNSNNFEMHHSYDVSYSTFGSNSLALTTYTNSMFYRFSNKLNVQVDASVVYSPYSTLGKNFQNDINGIYLSKAAVNYHPWKDVFITFQYRSLPVTYYSPFSGYRENFFNSGDGYWGW
ncbi:MAG TPA: hypothetical protein VLB50_14195 [Ignavibacteriaceae bacterium]|nr:hypothetical protein [Ignavibacteriaceae bacterium]